MLFIRQNATHKVVLGPFVDVTDGFTPETGITLGAADEAEAILHDNGTVVDISGYTWAAITSADGYYHLTLQSGITGTVGHLTIVVQDDSVCLPVKADFTIVEEAVYDAFFASAADLHTAAISDIESSLVIVKSDLVVITSDTTAIHSDTTIIASDVVQIYSDTTVIASDVVQVYSDTTAIHSDTTIIASDVVQIYSDTTVIASDVVQVYSDTTAIYSDTTLISSDTAAIESDTTIIEDTVVLASGTADSGSTTTMVDAARTESDDDYWNGKQILFTSGNIDGQVREITDFVAATDTITFSPATTQAVSTQTYRIIPGVASSGMSAAQDSKLTKVTSDVVIIGSDVVEIYSDTTAIHSDTTIIASDLVLVYSDTTAIHSDTTIIASDIVVLDNAISDVESSLVIVKSDTAAIETDTGNIYSDTTIIASDVVVIDNAVSDVESSLVIVKSDLVQVYSDTTAIHSDTTIIASDVVLIYSDTTVIASDTAAIETDTSTTLPGIIDDLAVKKNAAFSNFEFLMVLTSDHVTPATSKTVTGQRSIDGAAFASVGGTIAEVSNGIYQFDALAADTNGDVITWRFSATDCDDTFVTFKTVQ